MDWKDKYLRKTKPAYNELLKYFPENIRDMFLHFNQEMNEKYSVYNRWHRYESSYGWVYGFCRNYRCELLSVIVQSDSFRVLGISVKDEESLQKALEKAKIKYKDGYEERYAAICEKRRANQIERTKKRMEREKSQMEQITVNVDLEKFNKFKWCKKVSRNDLLRLYQSESKGLLDEELLDEVGYTFYTRCTQAKQARELMDKGQILCLNCGAVLSADIIKVAGYTPFSKDNLPIKCECGHSYTYREYRRSCNTANMPGGRATPIFEQFAQKWPGLKACYNDNGKEVGIVDILTQLNQAMTYIEAHIDDDMALADVSSVTLYSPYHFGRLFYYIADMPLSEYIRKRKLSLAAMALQSSSAKVIDLAVQYGYDSADSFARAFVKQHGVTPSVARQSGVNLTIFPPLTFQIKIKGVQAMNWRIEEKEAFEVFGIERIFANNETDKVPGFWDECFENGEYEKLYQTAGTKCDEDGKHCINAVCGYSEPGDDSFPYMLCALKKPGSDTSGFKVAQIPKTTWAVFKSDKSDHMGVQIPALFNRAYSEWLPSSGYDKSLGPDMEIYYTDADGKYFEEVWIPVRKI